ncbi:copper metallochaperone ATX1 PWA37_002888 [Arxiozyma heterogenica]|uniref:copper metallochaperone ATX1 n=1 Tax=Arxiozyma heterogenica TaxID=278026 RepID=UPI002F226FF7
MTNHYQFEVIMTCSGCSNAIDRVLKRLEPDVSKYVISLKKQTVDIETTLPLETILSKIQKTGKEVTGSKVIETPLI